MQKHLSIVGVPMDLGQQRRGVDMGPSAIRYAGIIQRLRRLGYQIEDRGDIEIGRPNDGIGKEDDAGSGRNLKNEYEVMEANEKLASVVSDIVEQKHFPLILGGDHSIAIGTLAGVAHHYEQLGVIWFDAHGDLNTDQTSPSGNIHGMPLAASIGYGARELTQIGGKMPKVKPENVVMIAVRSLDPGEKELIRQEGIQVYTMHEIDRMGMARVMEEAIRYVSKNTDGVHLSLDLDALDPNEAPGVGTPVIGGVSYRESQLAMEMLAEADIVTSAEIVEVNPILDERNRTAEVAVALAGSLFGEKLI